MVAENTFRPPWFHRNCMAEYMGLISGSYDAKKEGKFRVFLLLGFLPGGGSLHSIATPHGPDSDVFSDATKAALKPVKLPDDGLAFMFETNQFLQVTKAALQDGGVVEIQKNYAQCWQGMKKFFDPLNSAAGPRS
jgi:homogentisate 1,2-dioxygenase